LALIPAAATLKPTPAAKRMMAEQLYVRGRHFIAAAILLHQHDGDENVVVHLLCQGLELLLKGLLLARNFDKYQPRLKGQYGHRLTRLVCDTLAEFKSFATSAYGGVTKSRGVVCDEHLSLRLDAAFFG